MSDRYNRGEDMARAERLDELEAEIARLREAAQPLAEIAEADWAYDEPDSVAVRVPLGSLRRLRDALR